MSEKSSFIRLAAPGLPTWPRLYFERQQQRAIVTFRLATWRSWERAFLLTKLSSWIVNLIAAVYLWHWLGLIPFPIARIFLTFLGYAMTAAITKPLFPAAFAGFFARRIFAIRCTFWFSPQAIACRSPLYENNLLLQRHWHNFPVQFRFDITPDTETQQKATLSAETPHQLRRQYHSAQLLRLIITTHNPHQTISATNNPLMRSIPLLEINTKDAAQVATVLTTATALTTCITKQSTTPQAQDIDLSRS